MHSRSQAFFAARECSWSLLVAYSKNARPRPRSTTTAIPTFKAEFTVSASNGKIYGNAPPGREGGPAQQSGSTNCQVPRQISPSAVLGLAGLRRLSDALRQSSASAAHPRKLGVAINRSRNPFPAAQAMQSGARTQKERMQPKRRTTCVITVYCGSPTR